MTDSTVAWQDTLALSTKKAEAGAKAKKQAGILLWDGAKSAVTEYTDDAAADPDGEKFQAAVLDALGEKQKGTASKIKQVALAVVKNGLVLANYDNLSQAYAEATRLTKTIKVQAAEDEAAEAATEAIEAPKSSSSPEGAAKIVMSQGVDEAARLLLAAMGVTEHAAHRALARAIVQEAAGLIPKPEPKVKAAPKPKGAAKKAAAPAKDGASKTKAAPVAAKPKPVKKAAAPAPVEVEEADDLDDDAPVIDGEDMFADLDDDEDTVDEVVTAPVKKAAKPGRRGPVRRG